MKTTKKIWLNLILTLACGTVMLALAPAAYATQAQQAQQAQNNISVFDGKALYKAAFEAVRDTHIELVDQQARSAWIAQWQNKFSATELSTESGTDEAISKMLQSLGQRFDYYLDVEATKAENEQVNASLVGIGAKMMLRDQKAIIEALAKQPPTKAEVDAALKVSKGHELIVTSTVEGAPAAAVLKERDVITKVDGVAIDGLTMKEVVGKIRGKENTTVILTVERTDDQGVTTTQDFTITRKTVVMKVVATKDLGDGISYIKLDDFMSKNTATEMIAALKKASQGKGIVIDLRDNPGGNLAFVMDINESILPEGTMLIIKRRQGNKIQQHEEIALRNVTLNVDLDPANPAQQKMGQLDRLPLLVPGSMPIVVLVNEGSASASEILSGMLQSQKRAVIVGQTTVGKGVGQSVIKLPAGRSMHVTNFEFLPGGAKMDFVGIIPDIEVAQAEDDGKTDNQLDAATKKVKEMVSDTEARAAKAKAAEKTNRDNFQKALDKQSK